MGGVTYLSQPVRIEVVTTDVPELLLKAGFGGDGHQRIFDPGERRR